MGDGNPQDKAISFTAISVFLSFMAACSSLMVLISESGEQEKYFFTLLLSVDSLIPAKLHSAAEERLLLMFEQIYFFKSDMS